MSADERLIVMLEARIAEFERRMIAAERRGTRTYTGLQRGAKGAAVAMERDLTTAAARVNQALANVSGQIGAFGKAFAVGAVATGLGLITAEAGQAVRAIAEVGDMARRAGMGAEAFQQWAYVARQARIPVDGLTDGLKEMQLRADELVQTGAGPAAEAFKRLGLSAADLKAKLADPSALMLEIIGRLEGMDKAAQIRIADEVFGGTAGERFVELLAQGEEGIRGQMDRARELGLVMDEAMIAKAQILDAKFAEVGARLQSSFRSGVVAAAEFFGFVEAEYARVFEEGQARAILGDQVAEALKGNPVATEAAKADLQELALNYDQLLEAVTALDNALSGDIQTLVDLGAYEAAIELADVVAEMQNLAAAVRDGKVPAEELEGAMSDLIARADQALQSVQNIDGVDLSGAVAAVDRVSTALQTAVGWAGSLVAAIAEVAGVSVTPQDMTTGTPLTGTGADLLPPTEGQIETSPRPRPAPPMLGEPVVTRGGRGGGGGGGRSPLEGRINALIADLQTERELLTLWYEESLELINSATDAQLEAIGGRHEALERLEAEHMERLREIRSEGQGGILAEAESFFGAMAEAAAAGGDKMAKAARFFGALEAAANVGRAQAQVLADPKLPWWKKIPAMFAIGAAGMRVVQSIRGGGVATGGGGAVSASDPAEGGGDPSAADTSRARAPLLVRLEIDDEAMFSGRQFRRLVERITEEAGDGGVIFARGQA